MTEQDAGYTGTIAGVTFKAGLTTDRVTPDVRAYASRHGLRFDGDKLVIEALAGPPPADSRTLGRPTIVGTPLRDAAIDPRPEDFLPPVNAGKADPHGPEVVSPEIHGSQGVRPVLPGEVKPADLQEPVEKGDAASATLPEVEVPAASASKAKWIEFVLATEPDADPDELASLKRDEIVARYGAGD